MHLIPEKKLSKLNEEDKKTVRRLDAWGWFLAGMTHVNFFGWVAGYGLFAASLAESMYKAPIPLVNKIVVGLIAFFQPWTLWAVHFMPIRVGFDISRDLLLASGLAIASSLIRNGTFFLLDKGNEYVDLIFRDYAEAEDK